ncbi:hypothetical protein [Desulfurispira natronophila]|uniref:Uncharacterized protein n=1 Tax=Desulfurispira natronophila TaxID=682562 RepID=A0A7W7Y5N6_9BACT|nr:hypothetical protein [Desulfurispira natronophila]MBB5022447.1 hypothetical protein [Desulfurispira natronophila]
MQWLTERLEHATISELTISALLTIVIVWAFVFGVKEQIAQARTGVAAEIEHTRQALARLHKVTKQGKDATEAPPSVWRKYQQFVFPGDLARDVTPVLLQHLQGAGQHSTHRLEETFLHESSVLNRVTHSLQIQGSGDEVVSLLNTLQHLPGTPLLSSWELHREGAHYKLKLNLESLENPRRNFTLPDEIRLVEAPAFFAERPTTASVAETAVANPAATDHPQVDLPDLQGVVVIANRSYAVFDGDYYRRGEAVGDSGFRVGRIESQQVWLESRGGTGEADAVPLHLP